MHQPHQAPYDLAEAYPSVVIVLSYIECKCVQLYLIFITLLIFSGCSGDHVPIHVDSVSTQSYNLAGVDSDGDGIDDDDEGTWDNDGDLIPNYLDEDDDNDSIPTSVEYAASIAAGVVNADSDAIPNWFDIDSDGDGLFDGDEGTEDLDNDGLPDFIDSDDDGDQISTLDERNDAAVLDISGVANSNDIDNDSLVNWHDNDADGDNVRDQVEGRDNTDGDSFYDYLDTDDDNDGIPTITELADADPLVDTDLDQIENWRDTDSDGDGISDEVEAGLDGDNDNIPDYLDTDDDNDGIPTLTELIAASQFSADMDNDNLPNWRDEDSDGDTALDIDEGENDFDSDTRPNYLDTDDDNDSISTAQEVLFANGNSDVDNDNQPNWADTDADGDGIDDATEGVADRNGNSIVAFLDPDEAVNPGADTDGDTLFDGDEITLGTNSLLSDSDQDGISDAVETDGGFFIDTDEDGILDALDPDSDGDGISDLQEGTIDLLSDGSGAWRSSDDDGDGIATATEHQRDGDIFGNDVDQDGIPNYLDTDSDGDGENDLDEGLGDDDNDGIPAYLDGNDEDDSLDADGDGITNVEEIQNLTNPLQADTDSDGLSDSDEGTADTDDDGTIDALDTDSDNDGIPDSVEGSSDLDGDSLANYRDTDDDGDGIPSAEEHSALPRLADADGDGLINAYDMDSDNDGIDDATELLADQDLDGVPNYIDPNDADTPDSDADGDGISNAEESMLGTYAYAIDTDQDGISDSIETQGGQNPRDSDDDGDIDALDTDSDNDGIHDQTESSTIDSDEDGTPNYRDTDDDQDGIPTAIEYAYSLRFGADIDGDGRDNHLDTDSDGDTVSDRVESYQDVDGDSIVDFLDSDDTNGSQADQDVDGLSSAHEYRLGSMPTNPDSDSDGINDGTEVGTDLMNPLDTDGDNTPNVFDTDDDNDSIPTSDEYQMGQSIGSDDPDEDGLVSWLDLDSDGDGISDSDEATLDEDGDGLADYLDDDRDNDGIGDTEDNCPDVANSDQGDYDGDSLGDACDPPESACSDGLDNDSDGVMDCDDEDCFGDPVCANPRLGEGYETQGSSCASTDGSQVLWFVLLFGLLGMLRKRANHTFIGALLICLAISGFQEQAYAQSDSIDLDPFSQLPANSANIGNVATSSTVPNLRLVLGVSLKYSDKPLTIGLSDGSEGDANPRVPELTRVIGSQLKLDFSITLGILDWVDIGVAIPTINNLDVNGSSLGRTQTELGGYGLGDIKLALRTRLHPEKALGDFGLAALVVAHLPTGDPTGLRGEGEAVINLPRNPDATPQTQGSFRVEPRIVADVTIEGARFAVNLGYQIRPTVQMFDALASNTFTYGLALESPVWDAWQLAATLNGAMATKDSINPNDPENSLEGHNTSGTDIALLVSHSGESGIQYTFSAQSSLSDGPGSAGLRVAAGLRYDFDMIDPDNIDTDGDGLRDGLDHCPGVPEDADGFADDDGCPELDNDMDGIADTEDKCPDLSEDLDGFEDTDGCNDPDNDNDLIPDVKDECPGQAEDKDGFDDSDGCPEVDNDYDGVLDTDDKCPMEAEDMDGFEDSDGCPELDNDKDGTLDTDDSCPSDPKNQCIAARQGDFIRFHGKILFELGKAKLLSQSLGIIEAVIEVLRNSDDIRMVEIRGHTDSSGDAEYNRTLSQSRAESVMKYMIAAGISAKRLRAVGYGEEKSLRSNDTETGRAVNRRVEFQIIRLD